MKTIIHVNQHVIKANRKSGRSDPVITVKDYKRTRYAQTVKLHGEATIVYRPDAPLPCGAHVWVETHGAVEIA